MSKCNVLDHKIYTYPFMEKFNSRKEAVKFTKSEKLGRYIIIKKPSKYVVYYD